LERGHPAGSAGFAGPAGIAGSRIDELHDPLPKDWYPLAWNPAGSELLMTGVPHGETQLLGTWTLTAPRRITVIGKLSRAMGVAQVGWLGKAARM